jgi:hypothetical protein
MRAALKPSNRTEKPTNTGVASLSDTKDSKHIPLTVNALTDSRTESAKMFEKTLVGSSSTGLTVLVLYDVTAATGDKK